MGDARAALQGRRSAARLECYSLREGCSSSSSCEAHGKGVLRWFSMHCDRPVCVPRVWRFSGCREVERGGGALTWLVRGMF